MYLKQNKTKTDRHRKGSKEMTNERMDNRREKQFERMRKSNGFEEKTVT